MTNLWSKCLKLLSKSFWRTKTFLTKNSSQISFQIGTKFCIISKGWIRILPRSICSHLLSQGRQMCILTQLIWSQASIRSLFMTLLRSSTTKRLLSLRSIPTKIQWLNRTVCFRSWCWSSKRRSIKRSMRLSNGNQTLNLWARNVRTLLIQSVSKMRVKGTSCLRILSHTTSCPTSLIFKNASSTILTTSGSLGTCTFIFLQQEGRI